MPLHHTPSTLSILCHNLLQTIEANSGAFPGVPNYTLIRSEPATADFFMSIFAYLSSEFDLPPITAVSATPERFQDHLNSLGPDFSDLVTVCKRLAYRPPHSPRDDLSKVNPYSHFDLPTLLAYTSQTHHTLKHYSKFILSQPVNDHFSSPQAARTFLATFHNIRFATTAYAVETARLPSNPPHFINRHIYESRLDLLHAADGHAAII